MSEESEAPAYKFYGLAGKTNIFAYPHCETDRFWRQSLGLTPERYYKSDYLSFDECDNAFTKPKAPVKIDLLQHLLKKADFE
jgi:hypothetical protein